MSEFINTIDILGDDAVIDSIIQRTITEFKDNRVNTVRGYAFRACSALETIDLPNVESINDYAFAECPVLSSVSIPCVTSFRNYAFIDCTSLESVRLPRIKTILSGVFSRSNLTSLIIDSLNGVATLNNSNCFNNTPIASGTGYIYVPTTLVDSYKSATNWSTYASQIRAIEDYPEITGG